MASLYQKNRVWYLSVSYHKQRITRSLRTMDKESAIKLKPTVELELISEVTGESEESQEITFNKLAEQYLNHNHNWTPRTWETVSYIINACKQGKPLPTNPTTRAIHVRHINCCWNWGLKNGLIAKAYKLEGNTKGIARDRVLSKEELTTIFDAITDHDFNQFLQFAYYTGARSGEIRSLKPENVREGYLAVSGKTGRRMIKLNSQSQMILNDRDSLWQYTKDFISHKFKKETRRLGINDVRFHDLRRTFGYNLIKQGRSIYEVSKLLGHSSVTTTERHYAPLMVTHIDDFLL